MELEGVGKRYGARGAWVLRDVGMELPDGGLVRAEGANGSGKSTLLRVVAGVTAPTRGVVRGRPARCGYVPERFPPALPFSAREYLVRLGRVHGLRVDAARRAADAQLERFGAAGFARTPLAELSKGTCQKVAVAQALVGDPELLVLDEAWTGLDQAARGELDDAVGERLAAGAQVLFVDHDPTRLAERVDAHCRVTGGAVRTVAAPHRTRRMLIEYTGAARLPARFPGVVAVSERSGGVLRVETEEECSDSVLRELLRTPDVHVLGVSQK